MPKIGWHSYLHGKMNLNLPFSLRCPVVASFIVCSSSLLLLLGSNQTVKKPTLLGTETSAGQREQSSGIEYYTLKPPTDWKRWDEAENREPLAEIWTLITILTLEKTLGHILPLSNFFKE